MQLAHIPLDQLNIPLNIHGKPRPTYPTSCPAYVRAACWCHSL